MITNTATMPALTPAQQADAAQYATTTEAKAENTKQVAALADGAPGTHIAEHIRGMVAATVTHVSTNATTSVQADTDHWQQWALGVANGFERGVPAVV